MTRCDLSGTGSGNESSVKNPGRKKRQGSLGPPGGMRSISNKNLKFKQFMQTVIITILYKDSLLLAGMKHKTELLKGA